MSSNILMSLLFFVILIFAHLIHFCCRIQRRYERHRNHPFFSFKNLGQWATSVFSAGGVILISGYVYRFFFFDCHTGEVLIACSGWRSEMLLTSYEAQDSPSQQRMIPSNVHMLL